VPEGTGDLALQGYPASFSTLEVTGVLTGTTGRAAIITIAPSNAGTLSRLQADVLCDSTDDQTEINAAITEVVNLGGGKVVLLEGDFTISAPIYIYTPQYAGVTLEGQGIEATYVVLANNSDCNMFEMHQTAAYNVEYFTLRDMQLSGNGSNQTTGDIINLSAGTGSYVPNYFFMENLRLGSAYDNCFDCTSTNSTRINTVVMSGASSSPVFLETSCDGIQSVNLTILKQSGPNSTMTSDAASGQKDVGVSSTATFTAGEAVRIFDDNSREVNTISSIAGGTLTMTTNLTNTYATGSSGAVREIEDAITFSGGSESDFVNTTVDGAYSEHGIVTYNVSRLAFTNFYVGAQWKNGIYCSGSGDSLIFSNGNVLGQSLMTGSYYGLYIEADGSIYNDITLERNSGTGSMRGVYIASGGTNNVITNINVEEVDTPTSYGVVDDSGGGWNAISNIIGADIGTQLLNTLTTDDTAYGDYKNKTVTENTQGFGNLLSLTTNGVYQDATCGTPNSIAIAIACESGTGAGKPVYFSGSELYDTGWSWTTGDTLYLGLDGGISSGTPSTSDHMVQVVAIASGTYSAIFEPSLSTRVVN